jgi:hypothetical protein
VHQLDEFSAYLGLRGSNLKATTAQANTYGNAIASTMTFSTGIFLTGARLLEPFFRFILLQKWYQYYGEEPPVDKDNLELFNVPLSNFISSSLNVELVYILLESITTFSKLTSVQSRTGIVTRIKNKNALG